MQIHLIMLSEEGSTYVTLEAKETTQCYKCACNGETIQLKKADEYKFIAGRGLCVAIMYGRDPQELFSKFQNAVTIINQPADVDSPAADCPEAEPNKDGLPLGLADELEEYNERLTPAPQSAEAGKSSNESADENAAPVLVNAMLPYEFLESAKNHDEAMRNGDETVCAFCEGVFSSFLADIETMPDGNLSAKCPYCGTELQNADQLATKQIIVHTDGACLGNPGPGGWAAILHSGKWEKALSGGDADTTNNRMEIMGALSALQWLHDNSYKGRVTVISDSQYLVHAITKHWAENWQRGGWIKGDGKPAKNPDLWQRLLDLIKTFAKVDFLWVKGHAGDYYNERCDRLANMQAGIGG